jgi:hypothetical protein
MLHILLLSRLLLAAFVCLLLAQIVLIVFWSFYPPNNYQFPNATYPNATSANPYTIAGSVANETSPPFYPSPWGTGLGNWSAAYAKAVAFVSQLTLPEKVNLTTGVGYVAFPRGIGPKNADNCLAGSLNDVLDRMVCSPLHYLRPTF